MTQTKHIVYQMFAQVVLFLLIYAAFSLLVAIEFLPQAAPIPFLIPESLAWLNQNLLHRIIQTGLLAGGLYVIASEYNPDRLAHENLLRYTFYLWTLLLIATLAAGILDLSEFHPLLASLQIVALGLFIINAVRSLPRWSPFARVWLIGITLSGLCTLTDLFPTSPIHSLAANLNLNVAYVLMAIALGFWLMLRFSNISQLWVDESLYNVAGLLTLAGILISIVQLFPTPEPQFIIELMLSLVPLAYIILAAHSYRGLSDRNSSQTLAAHWYALAILLFLVGTGFLGALLTIPRVNWWVHTTHLTEAQTNLTALAVVALILSLMNQIGAELRGENRRITGLLPFWLIAFGIFGGNLALGTAGVVQVYLARVLTLPPDQNQILLIPLYILWILGWLTTATGFLIYALGFWARRPRIWDEPPD
jgi:hypothetical protein